MVLRNRICKLPTSAAMEMELFQQGQITHQRLIEDNGLPFPMVFLPPSHHPNYTLQSLLHTIVNHKGWIERQLKQAGALLIRGFPVKTASDFNAVVEAFGWEEQTYLGEASRTRIEGRVYTANESALHHSINFHHEMSKFEEFPTKLFFFCEIAPPEGGETVIVLSHGITQKMEQKYPELVAKVEKEGLFFTYVLPKEGEPDHFMKGWETAFQTKDKEEAERAAKSKLKCQVSWEGSKMIIQTGPFVSIRNFDGERKAWFNQVAFWGADAPQFMGDGSVFPPEAIESCIEIMEEECVEVKWEDGDVLLIDNRLVQHARRPSKPPRRVLVALCK